MFVHFYFFFLFFFEVCPCRADYGNRWLTCHVHSGKGDVVALVGVPVVIIGYPHASERFGK